MEEGSLIKHPGISWFKYPAGCFSCLPLSKLDISNSKFFPFVGWIFYQLGAPFFSRTFLWEKVTVFGVFACVFFFESNFTSPNKDLQPSKFSSSNLRIFCKMASQNFSDPWTAQEKLLVLRLWAAKWWLKKRPDKKVDTLPKASTSPKDRPGPKRKLQ